MIAHQCGSTMPIMKTAGICLVSLLLLLFSASGAWVATLHVPDEYGTIQDGIDASVDGDTVLVADGTYTGEGSKNLTYEGRAIAVVSENGAGVTVIDCEGDGRGFLFISGEDSLSMLQGFTITNGFTTGDGAGISCENSSPVISNCIITGNMADSGGGFYFYYSSPTVMNCIVTENTADYRGGAFDCRLSDPDIINCAISSNSAKYGGGFYFYLSNPTVINCTIFDNSAEKYGGGIYHYYTAFPTVTNCILWDDSPDEIYLYNDTSSPVVTYSDVEGGWEGEGNFHVDPLFLYPGSDDYHLTVYSPCVNSGTDAGVYEDIDGELRPFGLDFDIGVDEVMYEGPIIQVFPDSFFLLFRIGEDIEDETLIHS